MNIFIYANILMECQDYENYYRSQQLWGKELISKLHLKSDEHLLDIGWGNGKITAEIAGRLDQNHLASLFTDNPKKLCNQFIRDFAEIYLEIFPADKKGDITVKMVRLEVAIVKQCF